MPNKNYVKGVRKERQIVNQARADGLVAFRSAGSHSPIDVCIIDIMGRQINFIQCKPDTISKIKKWKIEQELKELNDVFKVNFQVK